jgi:hypothetical protein
VIIPVAEARPMGLPLRRRHRLPTAALRRSVIKVYLLAVAILLADAPADPGSLLPSLAALTLPALIVVTQRRLVGS